MDVDTLTAPPSNSSPIAEPIGLGELLTELKQIKTLLAEKSAAVLCREAAARFIGVSPATLDRLAAANPALRPVRVSQGRVVWRRADLQAYLDGLEQ